MIRYIRLLPHELKEGEFASNFMIQVYLYNTAQTYWKKKSDLIKLDFFPFILLSKLPNITYYLTVIMHIPSKQGLREGRKYYIMQDGGGEVKPPGMISGGNVVYCSGGLPPGGGKKKQRQLHKY